MNCPLCQQEGDLHLENDGYTFRRCRPCHHVYLDHRPSAHHVDDVYDDDYFFGGGSGYDDYLSLGEMLRERGRFYERKLRALMEPGRSLDVGSSAGFIASAFRDAGWEASGIEPNEHMVEYAAQRTGIPTIHGTMEEFTTERSFDAITAIQVAAHFCDPRKAFAACFAALRPGGCLLVETWNSESLVARMMRGSWHEYSPPSVLHCFSKTSLRGLIEEIGFEQVSSRTTLKKIRASHAKSLLRSKAESSVVMRAAAAASSLVPDRLSLYYPADDLFWAIYRRPMNVN